MILKIGTSPHGQGHETTWAQIVADGLGVTPDDVEVLHGDTADRRRSGMDTYGSRIASVGRTALHFALEKIKDKARTIAAHELEVDARTTSSGPTAASGVKGAPDKARTILDLAVSAWHAHALPAGVEPNLERDGRLRPAELHVARPARTSASSRSTPRPAATDIVRSTSPSTTAAP